MFEIKSVVFEELLGKIQHEILNFFTFVRFTFYNHKCVKNKQTYDSYVYIIKSGVAINMLLQVVIFL